MHFINIIHDSRRQERYDPLIKELQRQGIIDYTIWPTLILPQVVDSINYSHKEIVRQARYNGMNAVAIMEDDVMFPAIGGWNKFINSIPDADWDLYMAGTYSIIEPDNKVKCPIGLHCYIIHSRYYETFLNTPDNQHIDTAQEGRGEFYVCNPMVAIQREGFSANNKTDVNYNTILKREDVYGW